MTAAESGILRLETPWDKCSKSAGLFLQIVEPLEMIDAMLVIFSDPKHHGRCRTHADLVRRAVNIDPVFGQALQAGDLVAYFVIQNFRSSARNGIEPGVPQSQNRVANR